MDRTQEDIEGFDGVTELARGNVRRCITTMVVACPAGDAVQAVVLGGVAGAVECFVAACRDDVTRDRMVEALCEVVCDFVDQVRAAQSGAGAA